jgi:ATP-grasp domain, R2K clade family 3
MNHNIIFPAYPDTPRKLNPYFQAEVNAAQSAGFGISIASDETTSGGVRITNLTAQDYLYRGWLVKPAYYQEMSELVKPFLNSHQDYMSSYNFPNWYSHFTHQDTPESLIIKAEDIANNGLEWVVKQVQDYFQSDAPLMMKDFLKSLKYEWYDACLIKDGSDAKEIMRITTNFFQLRGRDFVGGLVYRKLLNLKRAGIHPKTRTPVPIEFRTFFVKQKPILTISIWEKEVGIDYRTEGVPPPQQFLESVGQKIISPFVAVDIAKTNDDKWWVIEVNDGGAAGLPEHMDYKEFYTKLFEGIS